MDDWRTWRVRAANDALARPDGEYVLYWMIAARRTAWSFGLDRAIEEARRLGRPLLVFEPLRVAYPWASDRLHRFVLDGMRDNATRFGAAGVTYLPYAEARPGDGKGLLEALARRACLVVTDEFPGFFLPKMVAAAARRLPVRLETVDGNGVLPLRAAGRAFPTAHGFRRHLQKTLPAHLLAAPSADPLSRPGPPLAGAVIPAEVGDRWGATPLAALGDPVWLQALPIDHGVGAAPIQGGSAAGAAALGRFLDRGLSRYAEDRNKPELEVTSGLSPYLHFGHVSAHEVVHAVLERGRWSPAQVAPKAHGGRAGWWGLDPPSEAFLDQVITWRELGYVFAFERPEDHDHYEALPAWALKTLEDHADDPRPALYRLDDFASAATHDPLWNAAQRQLVTEGRIHNYLRMLWGKKILEWTRHPREALDVMLELNNRYALDGRDPNSVSGIFWTLGRFDRAWGPERLVFGKIRYMTSQNTARKVRVKDYLARYGPG